MTIKNILSFSGGKDSTALLLLALEQNVSDLTVVFADTGNEHALTYEFVEYIDRTVFPITRVKADFSQRMEGKRAFILKKWADDGVSQEKIDAALQVIHPSGNQFLDCCLWKGRFPSTRRRFCSQHLKHEPIRKQIVDPILKAGDVVLSWQGVRAEESPSRAALPAFEAPDPTEALYVWRPLLQWTADQVFDMHRKHGIQWNKLYEMGFSRVGCMPCIHERKAGLREIADRFPEELDRIHGWEKLVSEASKQGISTFYDVRIIEKKDTKNVHWSTHGMPKIVEWCRTTHGGKDVIEPRNDDELEVCSSIYGLCETAE